MEEREGEWIFEVYINSAMLLFCANSNGQNKMITSNRAIRKLEF